MFDFVSLNGAMTSKNNWAYRVKCGFLEIYKEEIRDLLHPGTDPKKIQIRENEMGGIIVQNSKDVEVGSTDEAFSLLRKGCSYRTTGQTRMNEKVSEGP